MKIKKQLPQGSLINAFFIKKNKKKRFSIILVFDFLNFLENKLILINKKEYSKESSK